MYVRGPSFAHHPQGAQAEANTARGVKNVSISAWFYALMETLDIMPDKAIQEWHQTLQWARCFRESGARPRDLMDEANSEAEQSDEE